MKKSLKKVMLFGVMFLALGASFVGCKDYDDDIDGLNNKINELEESLKSLSGTAVKSVTYDEAEGVLVVTKVDDTSTEIPIGKDVVTYEITSDDSVEGQVTITLTGSDGKNSEVVIKLPEGGDGEGEGGDGEGEGSDGSDETPTVNEFDPSLLTVGDDGYIYYDGEKTGAEIPVYEHPGGIITVVLNDNGDPINYIITQNGVNYTLPISDSLPLKSLVFEPQSYLSGVQAMKAGSLAYKAWTQKTDAPGENGEVLNAPLSSDTTTLSLQVVSYYHLNPASVTENQIKSVSVVSSDTEFVGARAAQSNPTVASYAIENGMLRVVFNVSSEYIRSVDAGEITTLAIQANVDYQGETTTVTSDYAAIYRSIMQSFKLALNDKPETDHDGSLNQRHLYGADSYTCGPNLSDSDYVSNYPDSSLAGYAQVAIESDYDYTVSYKNASLNLKEKIAVHYREKLDGSIDQYPLSAEKIMANPEDYGLKLRFSKSDYIQGGNETNQSDFFNLTEDGVVTAKVFDDETGSGTAAINREPLVRVDLVDVANNKVVNAGWIKVLITGEPTTVVDPVVFDFPSFLIHCDSVEYKTTVEQMNVQLYNKVGMDKTTFHEIYTLSIDTLSGEAILQNTGDLGIVTESADALSTETNLLIWTIAPDDMETALANGGELSATVIYTANGRDDVVVTLNSSVTEATATMGGKIPEYWNASETSMYVNVEVPGTLTNKGDFFTNINGVFTGNLPTFNISPSSAQTSYPEDYLWNPDDTNNMGYYFQFKAPTGTTTEYDAAGKAYKITVDNSFVNNDGYPTEANQSYSYLLATNDNDGETQLVATLDTYTGIIEYNNGLDSLTGYGANPAESLIDRVGVSFHGDSNVSYPNNEYATALLNRDQATGTNMFSANIETILHNACRNIQVTNGEFKATFYRPVNATASANNKFTDSKNNGDSINYVDLIKLTDWRLYVGNTGYWGENENFLTVDLSGEANKNGENWKSYWSYYDVEKITLDEENVTTTLGEGSTLGVTKLGDISESISLTDQPKTPTDEQKQAYSDVDYGCIRYANNGTSVMASFMIRLPITVTYRWGELTTYVDVEVVP